MSGISESKECPVCGNQMGTYNDWKPYDTSSGECPHCGFLYYTKVERLDLTDLNEKRAEYNEDRDLEPEDEGYLKDLTQEEYDKYNEEMEEYYN